MLVLSHFKAWIDLGIEKERERERKGERDEWIEIREDKLFSLSTSLLMEIKGLVNLSKISYGFDFRGFVFRVMVYDLQWPHKPKP